MPGHWGGSSSSSSSSSSSTGSHSRSYNPGAGGVVQHSAPKAKTKAKHSPHGGGPGTGHVSPKKKKKTTTVTTGGQSPFAYTKPPVIPKGRINIGITNTDKFKKWIANNKWKAALYGTGALTAGAGYQTLSDINKINQWSKMGYGAKSPVPANMLKNLTGAWVPNKVFEKLGYGAGSTKGWLTGRVSPTHFGPVEAAMKAFQSPVGKFATKALGPASVAYTAGDILTQRSKAMGTEANRISALEGPAQTQAIEDYATKMYKPYARGGLADLYRYGGFI